MKPYHYLWLTFAFILAVAVCFPIIDPDIFMYLSYGRLVVREGHLLISDPYTYLGSPWQVSHEWLSCLVFYFTYQIGGYAGLMIFRIALWLAALWCFVRAGTKMKIPQSIQWIFITIVFASCMHRFVDRSSFFSDLILCFLTAYFVTTERPTKKHLIALPILFVVWVNLHPAFILGLALYGLYGITRPLKEWRRQAMSLVTCIVACLVNPRFHEGLIYPLAKALESDFKEFRRITFEWMPPFQEPFLSTTEVRFFISLIAMTTLLFLAHAVKNRKLPLFPLLAFALYMYFAQDAVRFITTASLSFCVIAFVLIRDLKITIPSKLNTYATATMSLAAAILGIFILMNGYDSTSGHREFGIGVDPKGFPIKATEFLAKTEGRIFNQYEWGAYLIWTLDRRDSIFIHTFHSDPKILTDLYYGIGRSQEDFDRAVAKYDIHYAILEKKPYRMKPIILESLERWNVVYDDELATIWQKPTPRD